MPSSKISLGNQVRTFFKKNQEKLQENSVHTNSLPLTKDQLQDSINNLYIWEETDFFRPSETLSGWGGCKYLEYITPKQEKHPNFLSPNDAMFDQTDQNTPTMLNLTGWAKSMVDRQFLFWKGICSQNFYYAYQPEKRVTLNKWLLI